MTTKERMAMIDKREKNLEQKTEEEKRSKELEIAIAKTAINHLKPRIKAILEVANYAMSHGINLHGKETWGCIEGYHTGLFFSNGWSHLVGIMDSQHLGIRAGGAFGSIDFYTDGENTYGFDTYYNQVVSPKLEDMDRFLKEFDTFEAKLYEFIDNECKKYE